MNATVSPFTGSLHRKISPEATIKESILLTRGQKFSFQDLLDEFILYSHDGSRSPEDIMKIMVNFSSILYIGVMIWLIDYIFSALIFFTLSNFQVSDGIHETEGILEFLILDKSNTPPRLLPNQGLTVRAGETSLITPSVLSAEDVDSDAEMITYIVTTLPDSGKLEMYEAQTRVWTEMVVGSLFLQKDVQSGSIR